MLNSIQHKIDAAIDEVRTNELCMNDAMARVFYLSYGVQPAYANIIVFDKIINGHVPSPFYEEYTIEDKIDLNKLHKDLVDMGMFYFQIDYESFYIYPTVTSPVVIYVTQSEIRLISLYDEMELCKTIQSKLTPKEKKDKKNEVGILVRHNGGHFVNNVTFDKMKIDIEKTYNDDLPIEAIDEFITTESTGLCLFYGEPGTGKSTFIKYLIDKYNDKKFTILNAELLYDTSSNSLISEFIDHKNAIYIIEDCEKLLVARDNESNPIISAFLNMTDGILAEVIQCKFICTFNTNLDNIDNALLRKGRLKLKYEFKKLDPKKVDKLLETDGSKEMTIADVIHNKHENDYSKKKTKRIGF